MNLMGDSLAAPGAESAEAPNPFCGEDMCATFMTVDENGRNGSTLQSISLKSQRSDLAHRHRRRNKEETNPNPTIPCGPASRASGSPWCNPTTSPPIVSRPRHWSQCAVADREENSGRCGGGFGGNWGTMDDPAHLAHSYRGQAAPYHRRRE